MGFFTSAIITVAMMGWVAVIYARLNPFLTLLVFPAFNAVLIIPATLVPIRAEDRNIPKLQTVPNGIRGTVIGALVISSMLALVENLIFQIILALFHDGLAMMFASTLIVSDFIPDSATFVIIVGCGISFYACYLAFVLWIMSQARVTEARNEKGLAKFEGFFSKPAFIVLLIAMALGILPVQMMFQTIVTTSPANTLVSIPAFWGILSIAINIVLSIYMWKVGWKTIEQRPLIQTLEGW